MPQPQRIFTHPGPNAPSPISTSSPHLKTHFYETPQSAGLPPKTTTGELSSPPARRPTEVVRRRHSNGPDAKPHLSGHTNVYTECGRHSDDWLFAPIKGAVKEIWVKKE